MQNKLPKPVKLRPAGAQLYGFGFVIYSAHLLMSLMNREFDTAICSLPRKLQMAKNGKNRLAILTIFSFRRTDVK